MHSTKITTGAMKVRTICRQTQLQAACSGYGMLGRCFASVSIPPPPKGGSEKAKETMDNVLDATKETSEKLKESVLGRGSDAEKPSKNPDLNHGVESTDSSCEDVRNRPGGYN